MGNVCSDCFGKRAVASDPSETEPILKQRSPAPDTAAATTSNAAAAAATTTSHQAADAGAKASAPVAIPQNDIITVGPLASLYSRGTFASKYELKEVLGLGSTSTCHRCVRKVDSSSFACKVIDKRQIEVKFTGLLEQFHVEIKILKELHHPNIIHLEDVYEVPERIYMVMEVMSGGELFDYVVEKGTLSEEEASAFIRQITSAIAYMHSRGVIHRDLKPENLLLKSKEPNAQIKIIDFGLAKIMQDTTVGTQSFLGTRGYLAPEMLQRNLYDKSIDIWALGVIVFVLVCGCLPFDDDSSKINSETAAREKFVLRYPRWASNLSAPAKDLLSNLLNVDPKSRFTAQQAVSHPWVTGKAVMPNNYLQSPSRLGERRRNQEPMTPNMKAMHDRLTAANNAAVAPAKEARATREARTGSF